MAWFMIWKLIINNAGIYDNGEHMYVDILRQNKVWRKTKIIATVGPASSTSYQIEKMIDAGVDIFRLNMSHGSAESHRKVASLIRRISKEKGSNVAILVDLCGPKIRLGKLPEGKITIVDGQDVTLVCCDSVAKDEICTSYKQLADDVKKDERIFIDDGHIELIVKSVNKGRVECNVVSGGMISDHKGMNLPDSRISIDSFTNKDKKDAETAIEIGADFIALSFVRTAGDIILLKDYLEKRQSRIPVIAKIEKPEALDNIDEILEESFGIMVARGDLGIELPAEKVPLVQEELVLKARSYCRPVIVATQMLESMINNQKPTRAEVGDVAHAAMSSADAVMLSAETASGRYPLESIRMMDVIVREIERSQLNRGYYFKIKDNMPARGGNIERYAVANAATRLVKDLNLKAIIIPTRSSATAKVIAASRPLAPLLGICSDEEVLRRMQLLWGVVPIGLDSETIQNWKGLCKEISGRCKIEIANGSVLLVSGFSDDNKSEPVIKVINLE